MIINLKLFGVSEMGRRSIEKSYGRGSVFFTGALNLMSFELK